MSAAGSPTAGQLIRFSAVTIPIAAAGMPLGVYLPSIYARDYGLSLSVIGLVFLFGRLWDAVSDPLIGTLSDATRSRFGRRKPWILSGGILFALCTVLLFFPPFPVTAWTLAAVLFFFYLGWTAVQIPYQAWSGEVSGEYHQRTRIATYQQVVASSALLLVLILPTIADQFRPADGQLQLSLMGGFVLLAIFPALFLTLTALKEPPLPLQIAPKPTVREIVRAVAGEPLLLRVLASDFAVTLAQNIRAALIVFFVTFYMGRPEWAGGLFLFQFVFGVFAGPIWLKIGRRYGKHRTAVAGEVVQVVINLALLLVTPESFPLLLALTLAQGLAQGSGNLMLRAIVADVADKHRVDTGKDRTGLFYSVFSLAGKSATAASVGIALPLVSWLGFNPTGTNSPEALHGLLLVFALGPAIAHALSAALIAGFPLDEAAHAEIRRKLEPAHADPVFAE